MACAAGPDIKEDGLVLALDAANTKSILSAVEVLVVAGGGGGGMDMGGGGGGGGVIYSSAVSITPGSAITATVGNGGVGAPAGSTNGQPGVHQFTISATQGGNSVFGELTAIGGGYGGSSYWGYTPNNGYGGTGGSGGGASGYNQGVGSDGTRGGSGTSGQGFAGGGGAINYYSGGGGGAGDAGVSGPSKPNGGPGVIYPSMSPYYFGGGGGGASYSLSTGGNGGNGGGGGGALGTTVGGSGLNPGSPGGGGGPNQWANTPGGNAGANTGGGGGGGSHYNANNKGGDGGSGIVIVRYPGSQRATGGTVTFVAGHTIHTFTTSGTFTPNFGDMSGNGNTGTLTAGQTYSSANSGSIGFAGASNQIVTVGTSDQYFYGGNLNITFEAWVKSPGLAVGKTVNGIFSFSYGNILYMSSDGNITFGIYNQTANDWGYFASTSGLNLLDNQWHQVVGTMTATTGAIYTDGVLRTSGAGTHTGTNVWIGMQAQIGNNQNDAYYHFNGNIAIAKFYRKALTAQEVQQNFNATRSRYSI